LIIFLNRGLLNLEFIFFKFTVITLKKTVWDLRLIFFQYKRGQHISNVSCSTFVQLSGIDLRFHVCGTEKIREMTETSSSSTSISKDLPSEHVLAVKRFFESVGIHASLPQNSTSKDFYSDLFRDLFKAGHVQRGHVSCIVPVLPVVGVRFSLFSLVFNSSRNWIAKQFIILTAIELL